MLAVGILAIGAIVGIVAAPASATAINNGQLAFNDGTINTEGTIDPGAGNTFTATFNGTGAAIVSTSSGDFLSILSTGAKSVTTSSVSFLYDTVALNYKSTNDLVFDFGPSSGVLTIASGSAFQDTVALTAGHSNFNFLGSSASFQQGTDPATIIPLTSFNFDVDNLPDTNPANTSPNGSYSLVTDLIGNPSTTQVPEPFTIVGTILGGTAAMRMRKKLAKAAQS